MSSSGPVNGGTNQSTWANQPSASRTGWGRDGEPGSTFRGFSRGRAGGRGAARGGHGRGRGGSGFRGGPSDRREDAEKKPAINDSQTKSLLDATKSTVPVSSPTGTVTSAGLKPPSRPRPTRKPSDQKPSKKVPTISADSAPPSNNIHGSHTLPSRPMARRRRSQTPSNSNMPAPLSPSVESNVTITASIQSAVTKDIPPHLAVVPGTPSFDIKHDLDVLVERVRAVARDRPTTPATHIDWARDEDEDSLPDLDDWGVTSSTSATEPKTASLKDSIISPILEGTLKALPTLGPGSSSIDTQAVGEADEAFVPPVESTVGSQVNEDVQQGETAVAQEVTPRNDKPKARRGSRAKNGREARSNSHNGDSKVGVGREDSDKATRAPVSPSEQKASEQTPSPKASLKVPLHPSLPPKPEAPLGVSSKRYSRNSVLEDPSSFQISLPPKPVTAENPPTPEKAITTEELTTSEKPALSERSITSENPSHDPAKQEPTADQPPAEMKPAESELVAERAYAGATPVEQGLSASMHAPAAKYTSIPSQPTSSPNLSTFNPAHGRSRTLGRPPGHPQPRSGNGISDSHSDSGHGVRSSTAQHLRTQSTPPTTGGTHSRVHSRPIITGDAISRLARTLGSTVPRREVGVSSTKD